MTIEQLSEFAVLAEHRNYLIAADMMYTTQATLSRHIMAMEEELGFLLFSRTTKRVELTPEGIRFLKYAQQARKIWEACQEELEGVRKKESGAFAVGYSAISMLYHVTDYLIRFMAEHAELEFRVFEAKRQELIDAVRSGSCEIAVYQENPFAPTEGVDTLRLSYDRLTAILPENHPLASAEKITLKQLKKDAFAASILKEEPASIFLEACRREGFEPNVIYPGVIATSMSSLIAKGSCVGLDWSRAARLHPSERVVVVPVEPELRSCTVVAYKKENLSEAGRQMITFLKENWREQV